MESGKVYHPRKIEGPRRSRPVGCPGKHADVEHDGPGYESSKTSLPPYQNRWLVITGDTIDCVPLAASDEVIIATGVSALGVACELLNAK